MITVHIPGVPIAKARPRMTRAGHVYTPAPSRKYEAMARQCAIVAMQGHARIDGPVQMNVVVGLPIPASWSKKKREAALFGGLRPTGRPDLDNYVKSAMDALNTIVWADDAQVISLSALKIYCLLPALTITVTEVNR